MSRPDKLRPLSDTELAYLPEWKWREIRLQDRQPTTTPREEQPFTPEWPVPLTRYLRDVQPPAPSLPLGDVLGPRLARWVEEAADSKGAPADYVFGGLLAMAGSVIGNARWVSPWHGWSEPPLIWVMIVGLPSAGKSPALDAVLHPLREAERPLREKAEQERAEWSERAEVAKIVEQAWKDEVRAAVKAGESSPDRPGGCDPGPPPVMPRLVVNDGTIERLGSLLAEQPRGVLQFRDELAGWLESMERYAGGGTDRPFWLEAYGGRGFSVERVNRGPLTIDSVSIGVAGGIQPARLKSLLFKADDDGLLARFLPIWPEPVPIKRPGAWTDDLLIDDIITRLHALEMVTDESDRMRPWFIHFAEPARDLMNEFRIACREWEANEDGLLLSFIGKLPGLAARLALMLALLDHAAEGGTEPHEITIQHFGRAAHLVETYILPMARRAYAETALPKDERAARRLVAIIRKTGWRSFSSRDVLRLDRAGLGKARELDPVLKLLIEGDCIRQIDMPRSEAGGRPPKLFAVNPAIHGDAA